MAIGCKCKQKDDTVQIKSHLFFTFAATVTKELLGVNQIEPKGPKEGDVGARRHLRRPHRQETKKQARGLLYEYEEKESLYFNSSFSLSACFCTAA